MTYRLFLILTCLFGNFTLLAANSTKRDSTTYYYSSVEFVETPLSYFKGSIPLSREVALTRNHYRFVYDDQHRLKSLAFYNGERPRAPNHTANLFTLAHRLAFTYTDTTETIAFFNTSGKPIGVLGGCFQFVYQLNELGFRESLHFADAAGQRMENSWNIYRYEWQYASDGTVIEDRFDREGKPVSIRPGFKFYRLRLHFNPAGHIALMQQIDPEGNLVENASGAAQDQITTNAAGSFLEWQVLDKNNELERGNGPDIAIGRQTFNEYGYEIRLESRDENNQLIFSHYGICISETDFDPWGNMRERRFYDADGQPTLHGNAGYHRLRLHWDATGNLRESMAYFDVSGRPTLHRERGFHRATYQYDSDNKLTQVQYFDTEGELVNRRDNGVAYIRYKYSRVGELNRTIQYTKDGTEIK